jgi:hypothetical protein
MLTYSQYSQILSETDSFYSPPDISGIIFEFTAINQSSTFNMNSSVVTTFPDYINVSAIATIDVSASSLNNLFYFQTADIDPTSLINPTKYGINASYKMNVSYSNSQLTYGAINNASGENILKKDYVNYLAYAITGGYNYGYIFKNQSELISNVTNMDNSFNQIINDSISTIQNNSTDINPTIININNSSIYLDVSLNQSPYVQSCKKLVEGLLSISNTSRGIQFLNDISEQNTIAMNTYGPPFINYYSILFYPGDIISLKITYNPYNGNATSIIGSNLVYDRSYKIMLMCQ